MSGNNKWILKEEFSNSCNYVGYCWICFQGKVRQAYLKNDGSFRLDHKSPTGYSWDAISHIMLFSLPPHPEEQGIIQGVYNSEINGSINWFWDGGFDISLGDEMNGVVSKHNVDTWEEVEEWFKEKVQEHYSDSEFSKSAL